MNVQVYLLLGWSTVFGASSADRKLFSKASGLKLMLRELYNDLSEATTLRPHSPSAPSAIVCVYERFFAQLKNRIKQPVS